MKPLVDEYARFSQLYDMIVGPFLIPVHRAMVASISSGQGSSVIDLCCGTGLMAGLAAGAGFNATGVDISPSMLAVARTKYPEVSFIEGDATLVPFSDGEFDAATLSFALHEKPVATATEIFREAVRVVKPDGMIVVADYRQPEGRRSLWTGWAISAVERMAGKEHSAYFKQYMKAGGTQAFLAHSGAESELIATFMHRWVGLYVYQKEQSATPCGGRTTRLRREG